MGIKDLLKALADGAYDGVRKDSEANGVSSGYYIDRGIPVKYREGKSTKFFDGKEKPRPLASEPRSGSRLMRRRSPSCRSTATSWRCLASTPRS